MKPVKNEFAHTNLISKALSMGIKVVHPGTFLAQAEAFLKLKDAKISKLERRVIPLKPPFIKVEDRSRQFRPLVREFSNWPSVKDFTKAQPEKIMKRCSRRQYCENCAVYFDNLREHVESDLHKNVIGQEGYYERVDTLIGSMPSLQEFVEKVRKKRHLKQHTGTGQGSSLWTKLCIRLKAINFPSFILSHDTCKLISLQIHAWEHILLDNKLEDFITMLQMMFSGTAT